MAASDRLRTSEPNDPASPFGFGIVNRLGR